MKTLDNIANLHNLRSIPRTRRSAKPQLPTTAVLDLCLARNERDRLIKERMRLKKRRIQINHRLTDINKEMDALLAAATKKAAEIRNQEGDMGKIKIKKAKAGVKDGRKRTVIEY